jgi:hypothetical protein
MSSLLGFARLATAATDYLTPSRLWLDRFALIIPAPVATRWLLIADAACLVAVGLASRRPRVAVPLALGLGFLALNVAGMVLNDFYLGLAVVHLAAGVAAVLLAGRWRPVGVVALCLGLLLAVLT